MMYTFFALDNISSITSKLNFVLSHIVYSRGVYTVVIRARLEIHAAQVLAIV